MIRGRECEIERDWGDVSGKHGEPERVIVAEVFAEEVKTLRATYEALGNVV